MAYDSVHAVDESGGVVRRLHSTWVVLYNGLELDLELLLEIESRDVVNDSKVDVPSVVDTILVHEVLDMSCHSVSGGKLGIFLGVRSKALVSVSVVVDKE